MSEHPINFASYEDTTQGLLSTPEAPPKLPFTPEQVALVNRQYDIELCLGIHGATASAFARHGLKGMGIKDAYYKEAAEVVRELRSSDILFIEGYGHTNEPYRPFRTNIGVLGYAAIRAVIEIQRQQQTIDAFQYAYDIAALKGRRIIFADLPKAHPQAIPSTELFKLARHRWGSKGRRKVDHITKLREEAARDILIQWALDHPIDTPNGARKPKLKLLFGSQHTNGLQKAFQEVGITATTIDLREHYLQNLEIGERINHIMSTLD